MKIIIRLIIMALLFCLSFLVLGAGAFTFMLNLFINGLSGFLSLLSSTISGQPDLSGTVTFIINLGLGIGILLLYYLIAHFMSKIFIRD